MKIGLISDIHGNSFALDCVLSSAKEKKVEAFICCGDYVGYYYEADKVISKLDKWKWYGVSGNHEKILHNWIKNINRNEIKLKYGSGTEFAAKNLSKKNILRLISMPSFRRIELDGFKIIVCHGSPWDRDEYIYPDAKPELINKLFEFDSDFDLLVYGHTHYPSFWNKGKKNIINPGSVGQPRDRKPGASWVLWDTYSNNFKFFREEYNFKSLIDMCDKIDPSIEYLSQVLKRK